MNISGNKFTKNEKLCIKELKKKYILNISYYSENNKQLEDDKKDSKVLAENNIETKFENNFNMIKHEMQLVEEFKNNNLYKYLNYWIWFRYI